MTGEEEQIFLTAREAIDRGAPQRYLRIEVHDQSDEAALAAADARFRTLPLLLLPPLRSLSINALESARGPLVTTATPFPATLWLGGATDVERGRQFKGTFGSFIGMLEARAKEIATKRTGWVIQPTTNVDGHRTNASTTAMHALFLDCDGGGEWHALLVELERLGLAYVAYRSGGDSPGAPKWRVVLPLSEPFAVTDDRKRAVWKAIYGHCRVVFGSVAMLSGEGFDGAVDAPAIPWFLTEKRRAEDAERDVRWREGNALDLTGLALALPPTVIEERAHGRNGQVAVITLASDKYRQLVEGLVITTSCVRSRRRDLYLSLPGVLLSRGVGADDVLSIIDEVSARYPRPDEVRHRDNVRASRTTIARWERGEPVTQIGTLNEIWPDVAKAVDAVLPNPMEAMLQATMGSMFGPPSVLAPPSPSLLPGAAPPPPPSTIAITGAVIKTMIRDLVHKKRKVKSHTAKLDGDMIERFIAGEALVFASEAALSPELANLALGDALNKVAKFLGNYLENIPWEAVLLVRPQPSREVYSPSALAQAGEIYTSAQKSKVIWRAEQEEKRAQAQQAYRDQIDAYYRAKRA